MRIKVWVTSLGIKMELKINENVEGWRNFTHGEDAVDVTAKSLEYHKNVVGGIWKGWLTLQGTLPWVKLYSLHISMKWLLTHLNWTLRVWPRRCVHRLPFWFVFSSSFHTQFLPLPKSWTPQSSQGRNQLLPYSCQCQQFKLFLGIMNILDDIQTGELFPAVPIFFFLVQIHQEGQQEPLECIS